MIITLHSCMSVSSVGYKGSVLSVEIREDHHRCAVLNYQRWRSSWSLRRGEEWPDNVHFHHGDLISAGPLLAGRGFNSVRSHTLWCVFLFLLYIIISELFACLYMKDVLCVRLLWIWLIHIWLYLLSFLTSILDLCVLFIKQSNTELCIYETSV